MPEPVISVAIEAKSSTEQPKMMEGLEKLVREDPSSSLRVDSETGQLLLSGMGELHLEILVDRLLREHKVKANVGKPQVTYRETIVSSAEGSSRFEREINNKLVKAEVAVEVTPLGRGEGLKVSWNLPKNVEVPETFREAIEVGVRESMDNGVLAGYQMVDMEAAVKRIDFEDESVSGVHSQRALGS